MPATLSIATRLQTPKHQPFYCQPTQLVGQVALMQAMFNGDDLAATASHLMALVERNPLDANALLDLAYSLILRGDAVTGLASQSQALQIKRFYSLQQADSATALRVLVLKTPGDFMANTPVEFLLDHPDLSVDVLFVGPDLPLPLAAPTHDAIFVAVSEADTNRDTLALIDQLLKCWQNPVINYPKEISCIGRDQVWKSLAGIDGLFMPVNRRESRLALENQSNLSYPVIIRPVGSHAGIGLERIDQLLDLRAYLSLQANNSFFLAPFIDYSSLDGQYRKYRIVFIDGEPFLCHMAISSTWMVHYLNAGMAENATKRNEEAQVMATFKSDFCIRHKRAFDGLIKAIGLDYFGIDCAETNDGQLLIFEVANAMVVHAMDPVAIYPYKAANMQTVFQAFQALLFRLARSPNPVLAASA
jgi:glutathione synthase/RimK-type ligase-like ATP-grasp enzyme